MKETYPRPRPKRPQDGASADGIIEGRNAVAEALRAGTPIDKVFLLKGEVDLPLRQLANQARQQGAVLAEVDRHKLDAMSRTHAHQGVIALAAVREYVSVESILQAAQLVDQPDLDGALAVQHRADIHDQLAVIHHQLPEFFRPDAAVGGDEPGDALLHFIEVGKGLRHPQHHAVHPYRVDGHGGGGGDKAVPGGNGQRHPDRVPAAQHQRNSSAMASPASTSPPTVLRMTRSPLML